VSYSRIPLEDVAVVGEGFHGPEGIAVDRAGNVYGGGEDGVIRRLSPDGRLSEFARCRGLGLAFDREENLFVCDGDNSAVLKVDRAGDISVFAEWAGELRLTWPNFAVFDADGDLWVSNSFDQPRTDVDIQAEVATPRPAGQLVRLRPDGRGEVVARGLFLPNGLAIDPNEEAIYVLQSTTHDCVRVPLGGGEREPFGGDLGGFPDGMAFAADGNLIVTLPRDRRLVVLDPEGRLTVLVEDPEAEKIVFPTNCAFGGPGYDELYVAQRRANHIARLALGRKGHPLYNLR
jgi:gluconolactonase